MSSQQTKDEAYWAIHGLYSEVADELDVELEGTEYDEFGVYSQHVHRSKKDHKRAIRLLSEALEEETDFGLEGLETWHEDYEDHTSYSDRWDTEDWDNPVGK